jgi:hypothetical protein
VREILVGLGALGAIVIAMLSFISTQLSLRRTVDTTYVKSIEDRLKDAEGRVSACEAARERMTVEINGVREENLWLTRQLLKLERDGKVTMDPANPLVMRAEMPEKLA